MTVKSVQQPAYVHVFERFGREIFFRFDLRSVLGLTRVFRTHPAPMVRLGPFFWGGGRNEFFVDNNKKIIYDTYTYSIRFNDISVLSKPSSLLGFSASQSELRRHVTERAYLSIQQLIY